MLMARRMHSAGYVYEVDRTGIIIDATDELCRALRCTRASLIGRDVREVLRPDYRQDFRLYVARALAGAGSAETMVPMLAPSGDEGWFKHTIEPTVREGRITGYRAVVVPPNPPAAKPRRWWQWPAAEPRPVWNFEMPKKTN